MPCEMCHFAVSVFCECKKSDLSILEDIFMLILLKKLFLPVNPHIS